MFLDVAIELNLPHPLCWYLFVVSLQPSTKPSWTRGYNVNVRCVDGGEIRRHLHVIGSDYEAQERLTGQVGSAKNLTGASIHGFTREFSAYLTVALEIKTCRPYSITERRVPGLIPVLGSQPASDVTHNCNYFPPGLQLPPQPLRGLLPISLLGEQGNDGCE